MSWAIILEFSIKSFIVWLDLMHGVNMSIKWLKPFIGDVAMKMDDPGERNAKKR